MANTTHPKGATHGYATTVNTNHQPSSSTFTNTNSNFQGDQLMPSASQYAQGDSKWLKAQDIGAIGATRMATIQRVGTALIGEGADAKEKLAVAFHEDLKPLGLNVTNCQNLIDAYGDDYGLWGEKPVELRVERTRYQGQTVPGLRIYGARATAQQPPQGFQDIADAPEEPDAGSGVPF